jgi:hypothetical protein
LWASEEKAILKEFLDNFRYSRRRKNQVILYHDVISFSQEDKENITPDVLEDIGCRYLQLRAPNALACAKVHFHGSNPHIHFMISGNQIQSPRQSRISRSEFKAIHRQLERYQQKKYPELVHSVVFGKKKGKGIKKTAREQEREKRLKRDNKKRKSQKEIVQEKFLYCLAALTPEDFKNRLEGQNFAVYRRGNTYGIEDTLQGKKYRLKTLGLDRVFWETVKRLDNAIHRENEIQKIRHNKFLALWKDLGFREDVKEVLSSGKCPQRVRELLKSKRRMERDM